MTNKAKEAIDRALRNLDAKKTKTYKTKTCEWCHGTGFKSNDRGYSTPCGACGGVGKVNKPERHE